MRLDESPYIMGLMHRAKSCSEIYDEYYTGWNDVVLCVDLETTGLNVIQDEILQICISDAKTYKPLIYTNVRPMWALEWRDAQRIHGIRPADVYTAPLFSEIAAQVSHILNGADAIIGYNVISYDLAMLAAHGVTIGSHVDVCDVMLDYAERAAKRDGLDKWRSLSECCSHYNIANTNAHDALSDCLRTSHALVSIAHDS